MIRRIFFGAAVAAFFSFIFCGKAFCDQGLTKEQAQEAALEEEQKLTQQEEEQEAGAKVYKQRLREIISEKEPEELELGWESDTYYRYMAASDAYDMDGSVKVMDTATELTYEFKAFDKLPIQFGLGTRYIGLNNSTAVELPSHLTAFESGIEVTLPFFNLDKKYLRLGVYPSFFDDGWNFHSSSFRMPVHIFMIGQPNDQLTYIFGVAVRPGFEDECVPIAGFIYKYDDRLTFNIVPPGPNITYQVNDKLSFLLEGDFSGAEFEVQKDDMPNEILNYNEIHAGVGVGYSPNKYIDTYLSCGYMFNRNLKYRQDYLGKVNIKSGLYTEFRIDIKI